MLKEAMQICASLLRLDRSNSTSVKARVPRGQPHWVPVPSQYPKTVLPGASPCTHGRQRRCSASGDSAQPAKPAEQRRRGAYDIAEAGRVEDRALQCRLERGDMRAPFAGLRGARERSAAGCVRGGAFAAGSPARRTVRRHGRCGRARRGRAPGAGSSAAAPRPARRLRTAPPRVAPRLRASEPTESPERPAPSEMKPSSSPTTSGCSAQHTRGLLRLLCGTLSRTQVHALSHVAHS